MILIKQRLTDVRAMDHESHETSEQPRLAHVRSLLHLNEANKQKNIGISTPPVKKSGFYVIPEENDL